MSLTRSTYDRVTLPNGLLPLMKHHLRVDFDDDDVIITFKLGHAIQLFETLTGYCVNKATYAWMPEAPVVADPILMPNAMIGSTWWRVPVMRVGSFTASDTSGDVTAGYKLSGSSGFADVTPQYLYPVSAASGTELTTVLTCGYADVADLPATITDVVMRMASYLYEYREMQNMPGVDAIAYSNSLLAGWWVPRA